MYFCRQSELKMKKFIFIISLFSIYFLYSQKQVDSLFYIDYEKDTKWIAKLETYQLSKTEIKKVKINVSENFSHANSISDLTINYNSVIDNYINKYTSYKWLPKIYGLLNFYQPLFESKLIEYDLPTDLKYLTIVESNLNPVCGSWAGASGLWQFMPATGANYGLAKSSKVNLFYDPYMSTDAACRYLKYLYKYFGDWNLALSAYNCGEGRISNAIKKAGTKSYWVVREYLPAETKAYVPSFHAVRFIGKMYGLYYDNLPKLKYDYSSVKEFTVQNKTTFKSFANDNGINLETLYFLNPHIVTEEIPKGTFVYYIKK